MRSVAIPEKTSDPVINLALDTLQKTKQALVFVGTKRGAEKVAEDISKKTGKSSAALTELAEQARNVLTKPTKQCERLAECISKGVAFHHAGLHARQKELVEDNFRKGVIGIIACTPTLAMGVDLPAFRVVIRDLKRFGQRGMGFIPVLEYLQMAGRAGRPKFDSTGEAILVANSEGDAADVTERYIHGEPEEIYSKLAVEPVLRTYILSLISSRMVQTRKELLEFFSRTFWAHQFKDMNRLAMTMDKMLELLEEWEFILPSTKKKEDFVSASELDKDVAFRATFLGTRVAELYLDPLTAYQLIVAMNKSVATQTTKPISFVHTICTTLEMRPFLRVGVKEYDKVLAKVAEWDQWLLVSEPSAFDPEHDEYLNSTKTAMMLAEWMEEVDDEYLLETYNVRPGETRAKLDNAEWLLYSMTELANILNHNTLIKELNRVRFRLRYGVKEELLPLLKLEGIGRVRARKLFTAGVKDLGGVRKITLPKLTDILGKAVAISVKRQVGEDVPETAPDKVNRQLSKYDE
jgi:helicase